MLPRALSGTRMDQVNYAELANRKLIQSRIGQNDSGTLWLYPVTERLNVDYYIFGFE